MQHTSIFKISWFSYSKTKGTNWSDLHMTPDHRGAEQRRNCLDKC